MAVVGIRSSGAFVLLLVLLLPGVAAYSVEEAHLNWYEHEVRTIAPNVDLPGVVATLRLSADFQRCWDERPLPVCALILETDGLAALDNQRLEIRDRCRAENGSILCTTPAATLRVTNGSARIGYYGQAGTERAIRGEIALPLTLDTTVPSVASITTGLCIGDNGSTCYIAANVPSPVTVTFTDTQTAFDWRLVFLGRDGATGTRARECSGTVCTFDLITPCTDGQEFRLGLTSAGAVSSREDAQNTVAPFSGTRVVCKTDGPKIISFNITADGIAGQAVSGGTLSATARVTGGVGDVTVSVATGGILGGNLTNQTVMGACDAPDADGARTCAWELGPLADGTFTLSFIATDALGLYSKREQKVTVLRLVTLPNGTTLDLFTIVPGKLNPEALNRLALDVASANNLPYPSYLPYTVLRKKDGARIWRQELTACEYRTPSDKNWTASHNLLALGASSGTRGESHVMRPDADWNVSNRLDLQVRADRVTMALADEFATRCTIALVVQDGNTLYETPEFENITFKIVLRESPLGEPGAEFVKKITETQEKLEGSQARTIRKLEKWRQQADKYCGYVEQYVTIHNSMAVLMGIGDATCGFAGVGAAIKGVGGGIFTGLDGILEPMWNGMLPEGGPVGQTLNRVKQASDIGAVFGVIPDNNLLIQGGGPLRMFCMQVNCRVTATLSGDFKDDAGKKKQETEQRTRRAELNQKYPGLYDYDTTTGTYTPKNTASAGAQNQPGSSGQFGEDQTFAQYAKEEILENANVADPMRSMTGAVMTMCMGGVIYNLQKYQAIDCGYLQCLKDQSYYGHSINVCDQGRSYKLCTQVVGEAMELPFVRTVKNIMGNINHAIATAPNFLAKFFLNEYCNNACQSGASCLPAQTTCGNLQSTFCAVAGSAINAVDAAKQTQQAFGGLRDDSAAKRQLEICDQALRNQTAPSAPTAREQAESSYTNIETAAWERSVKAQGVESDQTRFLRHLDQAYLLANPKAKELPARYERKGDTIIPQDSTGNTLTAKPIRVETETTLGKTSTYVAMDYAGAGYVGAAKDKFGNFILGAGKNAIQTGTVTVNPAQVTDIGKDTVKDAQVKEGSGKEVRVLVPKKALDGYDENSDGLSMTGDEKLLTAVRGGANPATKDAAYRAYVFQTLTQANDEGWTNYQALQQKYTAWETQEQAFAKKIRDATTEAEKVAAEKEAREELAATAEIIAKERKSAPSQNTVRPPTPTSRYDELSTQFETEGYLSSSAAYETRMKDNALSAEEKEWARFGYGLAVQAEQQAKRDSKSREVSGYISGSYQEYLAFAETANAYLKVKEAGYSVVKEISPDTATDAHSLSVKQVTFKVVGKDGTIKETTTVFLVLKNGEISETLERLQAAGKEYAAAGETINDAEGILAEFRREPPAQNIQSTETSTAPARAAQADQGATAVETAAASVDVTAYNGIIDDMVKAGVLTEAEAQQYRNDLSKADALQAKLKQKGEAEKAKYENNPIYQASRPIAAKLTEYVAAQADLKSAQDAFSACSSECTAKKDALVQAQAKLQGLEQNTYVKQYAENQKAIDKARETARASCSVGSADCDELMKYADSLEKMNTAEGLLRTEAQQEKLTEDQIKRRESYMAAVSVISDYAVKWARDKGYLNWLSLSSWADDVPALQELLDFSNTYLDPDAFADNLCSETYDIRDNDDGAVYQVSQVGIARALATFGSEIRTYENEGRTEFLYVTVAHVVNPGPGNISFEIVMRDITSCAKAPCAESHSLMNGAALTLGEGESFSNGQYARTRIEYLPGEYGKVCLRFDHEFPDAQGKREYCRSIKEDSISVGSPIAPQPTATTAPSATGTGGASAAGNNPLEGWS